MTGVINEGAEEREGLAELGEWQAGSEDEMKPVLASAADITKTEEGGLTISIGEGDDEEVEVSVAAMLIHKMTLGKLNSWVLVYACARFARSASVARHTSAQRRRRLARRRLQRHAPAVPRGGLRAAPRYCGASWPRRRKRCAQWRRRWFMRTISASRWPTR